VTGPITSDSEWEITLAAWKLRRAEAKRLREPLPARPRRVIGSPHAIVPPGVLVGRLGGRVR
jgi:hypothetical protein